MVPVSTGHVLVEVCLAIFAGIVLARRGIDRRTDGKTGESANACPDQRACQPVAIGNPVADYAADSSAKDPAADTAITASRILAIIVAALVEPCVAIERGGLRRRGIVFVMRHRGRVVRRRIGWCTIRFGIFFRFVLIFIVGACLRLISIAGRGRDRLDDRL